MQMLFALTSVVFLVAGSLATPTSALEARAASCSFPSPPTTSSLPSAKTIPAGTTFDGKNVRLDRGSGACQGQREGGDKDAVFLVEDGATVQNVVIGANQAEGIHCLGKFIFPSANSDIYINVIFRFMHFKEW